MNEYPGEITPFLSRFQKRPYEFLDAKGVFWELGFFGSSQSALIGEGKDLMCDRQVRICHCPFSNCGKAVPEDAVGFSEGRFRWGSGRMGRHMED